MLFLLPIALLSGILTVFSPCVLPILPIVLASGAEGSKNRVKGVIFGLVLSFSLAALFLTSIVTAFKLSPNLIRDSASLLLVLIGISIIFPIWDKLQVHIERLFNKPVQSKGDGFTGGFFTGISLGIVWTPCVGPIVATISTLAAVNQLSLITVLIVFMYAIGVAIPLWFIATKGGAATAKLTFFKKNPVLIRRVFGLILILTALFIYFGFERDFQSWVLDNLPESWAQIAPTLESAFGVEDTLQDL